LFNIHDVSTILDRFQDQQLSANAQRPVYLCDLGKWM
jgi:hypothetical protein